MRRITELGQNRCPVSHSLFSFFILPPAFPFPNEVVPLRIGGFQNDLALPSVTILLLLLL